MQVGELGRSAARTLQGPNLPNDAQMYVVFEVLDTGMGIPSVKLRQVFDEQESDQADANWEGTGLGLPICA